MHVLRTSILALLAAAAGYAQSSTPLRADIPFSFLAGGATLAAGQYTVHQGPSRLISLKSADGKATAIVAAGTVVCAGVQTASKLVFHRYGNIYVLSQVWNEGESCGRQGTASPAERKLVARWKAPHETVLVALR
jgi:hypothetical protein